MFNLLKAGLIPLISWMLLTALGTNSSTAQNVGIGAASFVPNPSSMLDIQAGAGNNRGLLIPRITNAQRLAMNPLPAAAQGLLVYQTNSAGPSLEGFYYNISLTTAPSWIYISPGGGSGWGLTGDGGTNSAVNFIGTTDPVNWVIKTNNLERAQFLSTGELRINTTNPNPGEVVTVVADGVPGATNVLGPDAINGYSSTSGIAVYGQNTGTGIGLWGVNTDIGIGTRGDNITPTTVTGITTHGVYGSNSSVPTGTGITIGVGGYATAGALDVRGVNGQSQSTNGIGVAGFNTALSGPNFNAHGVYGQTSSQSAYGVAGVNTGVAGQAHGVQGTASSAGQAAGVRGFNNSSPGSGGASFGVRGSANGVPTGSGAVYGVRGDCVAATGVAYGVSGAVASPTGFGASGTNSNVSGTGVIGTGNNIGGNYLVSGSGGSFTGTTTGVFAIGTTAGTSTGLLGVSNGAGLLTFAGGSGISGSSDIFGVVGWSNSATADDRAGGYFDANTGTSYAYVGAITALGVNRKIEGNGTVNTTVKDTNGKLVVLSCPEAPENLFQDFGKGQLTNGKAHIQLDPIFSKNIRVDDAHPLRVFIQLGADCKGVYVVNETASGFDVNELQGGTSHAPFTWFVTANRADELNPDGTVVPYASERFAPAIGPAKYRKMEKATLITPELTVESNHLKPLPVVPPDTQVLKNRK